ncbi:ATP-binding protein [Glaciimonas sp. PCH181]|uniref:ATP-binding protein n=1 Tax=Glaciimonas sp. PCH181 TaxID=2133943 RepID=UPI000D3D3A9A|nr:ATP-binding protein [Glaciimonas sp. PCH181]PUA17322.1 hypothetical protein C7W93_15465 [Glaciimonas sp. PCH181]
MIIFVAGIHGVGKTYLAAPIAKQLGIRHATASQLIREERGGQSWGKDKQVSEVDDNQTALISAVSRLKESDPSLLLDGHFVLRGEHGVHIPIAEKVFRCLRIDAVLLLECDVEVISVRLSERGDHSWNVADLASFAIAEAAHANRVATMLGLPLQIMRTPNPAQFKEVVEALLKRRPHIQINA